MKPQPRAVLLPAGMAWRTIAAPNWTVPDGVERRRCRYDVGIDEVRQCGAPSVALYWINSKTGEALAPRLARGHCAEHLGPHHWVSHGEVWQWRACPLDEPVVIA